MREILFRGKRKLDNSWIFGSLHIEKFIDDEENLCCEICQCDVHPETVGQFTGLTDINGKKIFEGDIIKTKEYGKKGKNGVNFNDFDIFEIVYSSGAFKANNESRLFNLLSGRRYEVIGNIYDNPELLKG